MFHTSSAPDKPFKKGQAPEWRIQEGSQTICFPRENIVGKLKSSKGEMMIKVTHVLFPNHKCSHAECN
jgi:hypothetical protein